MVEVCHKFFFDSVIGKMAELEEKVVMTPKSKTANSTTLVIERKAVEPEASDKIHVAGGDHTGIIINKEKNYGMFFLPYFFINIKTFTGCIYYHKEKLYKYCLDFPTHSTLCFPLFTSTKYIMHKVMFVLYLI